MKKREMLPYGFVAYTGQVWSDVQVDTYNRLQERINKFISAGYTPSERILNSSHKMFVMFSMLVK